MKNKLSIYFLLLSILFLLQDCKKKDIEDVNPDFIGSWTYVSPGGSIMRKLKITTDNNSEFESCEKDATFILCTQPNCYKCTVNTTGRAKIRKDYMYIGLIRYKINNEPSMGSDGRLHMTLDGEGFTRDANGSCSDGIKNQNETDVDCGGVCSACKTCNDGILNQDETVIDCGGSKCDSCFTSCFYGIKSPATGFSNDYTAKIMSASYQNGLFIIKIDSNSVRQNITLEFRASSTGLFDLTSNTYVMPSYGYGYYYCEVGSGTIDITSFDQTNKKISGTFNFTGKNKSPQYAV